MDLATGDLPSESNEDSGAPDAPGRPSQSAGGSPERVALWVLETQNMLLLRLLSPELQDDPILETSLHYALKRGIEQAFQLEESELGVQRMGRGEHRTLMFYEAAEGGLGVLKRLVEEPDALIQVTREALRICHFDKDGRDQKPQCRQACYECLLSYANQLESHLLDRRRIRDFLLSLTQGTLAPRTRGRTRQEHLDQLLERVQSQFERRFLEHLARTGRRLPDDAQKTIREPRCIADFFYEPNVLVFCDGPPHDHPDQRRVDKALRRDLLARGYRVVVIRWDRDLEEQLQAYPDLFGLGTHTP